MKDKNAVALGRKGGSVTSEVKKAAVAENLRLARAKRWPEKKSNIGLKPVEVAIMDSIERKPDHDSANCRLYGCLMCKMLKSANG